MQIGNFNFHIVVTRRQSLERNVTDNRKPKRTTGDAPLSLRHKTPRNACSNRTVFSTSSSFLTQSLESSKCHLLNQQVSRQARSKDLLHSAPQGHAGSIDEGL